ncbi:MAG: shikimate kinase [Epulopiscium sp.]|nr:shikimate kinase [Candidatus Epulonipiscium sp.]
MISNITLIGFMGSGKTTVGKLLASILAYNFIDTDDLIESKEGISISEIFKTRGEEHFRQLESSTLNHVITLKNSVISTGGGIVTIDRNMEILKDANVIYLEATARQIYNNIKHDRSRPLLEGDDMYSKINEILDTRRSLYEGAADHIIQVDGKTPEEIASLILRRM